MPMVEAVVASVVGSDKIAKNVNADEAAVLGAALYGAGITRGFRTKDIRVQDLIPVGIDVTYEADKSDEGECKRAAVDQDAAAETMPVIDVEPRIITTHLFPALAKTGVKKTMTFKKTSDFAVRFSYQNDPKCVRSSTCIYCA